MNKVTNRIDKGPSPFQVGSIWVNDRVEPHEYFILSRISTLGEGNRIVHQYVCISLRDGQSLNELCESMEKAVNGLHHVEKDVGIILERRWEGDL